MDHLRAFGDKLNEKWRESGYDEREFPSRAADLLRAEQVLCKIALQDVLRTAAEGGGTFDGLQFRSDFSDLPYVVYRNARFYMEILVWTNSTTRVHDHAFSGAFGVICGDSLCVTYDFEVSERINSHFKIGNLVVDRCEHLRANDVRPILPAPDVIHTLYHIAKPTATLVVRTGAIPDARPQFVYGTSGIAVDCEYVDVVAKKQAQALNVLLQTDYKSGEQTALRALQQAPLDSQYWIVRGFDYSALPRGFASRPFWRGRSSAC